MNIEDLSKFWESHFEGFAPEAHNLKNEFSSRWVRFHALPESKRYPENEEEYKEVFRRHNLVLRELCGQETKLFVVLPEYSESEKFSNPEQEVRDLFESEYWCSIELNDEDDEEYKYYWHLHVAQVKFTGNEFDRLFRMVADDEISNIMIISPQNNVVFHPYDGGADIVLGSSEERDLIREKHSDWLSSHPAGL